MLYDFKFKIKNAPLQKQVGWQKINMDIIFEQTIIGNRYRILSFLGGGGFGRTYIAEDLKMPAHFRCVVKQLKPQTKDAEALKTAQRLFNTEAKVLHQLGSHPQIPSLLAYFEEEGDFFLVQELIEGTSLAEEIKPGKRWGEEYVIALLEDILPTLAFIHQQNVIHRDLKPANIIRRAKDGKLVLIDFGAVKQVSFEKNNKTIFIGTQGYIPPEQQAGTPQTNSDIYALGMIAIEALTGIHPYQWQGEGMEVVSKGLAAILNKMICYDCNKRYQLAEEVLADLAKLRNSQPRLVPINNQQKKLLYILLSGGILAIVGAGLVFWYSSQDIIAASKALKQENFTEAIAAAERAVKKHPNNPQAWKIRGDIFLNSERYLQALTSYEKAIQLNPKNYQFLNSQGEALLGLERYKQALEVFEKALALNENNISLNGKGLALIGLERYQEALNAFEQAGKKQPNDPKIWENRGLALEFLGDNHQARQAFEEALASYKDRIIANPKDIQSHLNSGKILNKLRRFNEALTAFEKALAINSNYFSAWREKANTLIKMERFQEALSSCDMAIKISPDNPDIWFIRGEALEKLQRYQEAIKAYDKALEISPNFSKAAVARQQLQSKLGNFIR